MRERASQAEVFVPGVFPASPCSRTCRSLGTDRPQSTALGTCKKFRRLSQWGVCQMVPAVYVGRAFYKLLFGDSPMRVFFSILVFFMSKPSSQQVDILLIGYPCKSISAQNNNAKSFLDESSSSGGGVCKLDEVC